MRIFCTQNLEKKRGASAISNKRAFGGSAFANQYNIGLGHSNQGD